MCLHFHFPSIKQKTLKRRLFCPWLVDCASDGFGLGWGRLGLLSCWLLSCGCSESVTLDSGLPALPFSSFSDSQRSTEMACVHLDSRPASSLALRPVALTALVPQPCAPRAVYLVTGFRDPGGKGIGKESPGPDILTPSPWSLESTLTSSQEHKRQRHTL